MRKLAALCLVLLLGLAAVGCSTYSGGVAPSNVPLEPNSYTTGGRVTGTSWGVNILWFIPVSFCSTQSALAAALDESGGRALVQVTVDTRKYYWVPLMYLERIKVEGISVRPVRPKETSSK